VQLSSISAAAASIPHPWRNVTVGTGGLAPDIALRPVKTGIACRRSSEGGTSLMVTPVPSRIVRNEDERGIRYGEEP
jgi:hypothetical protein